MPLNALFWATTHDFDPARTQVLNAATLDVVDGVWSDLWIGLTDVVAFRPYTVYWDPNTTYQVRMYESPWAMLEDDRFAADLPNSVVSVLSFTTGTVALEADVPEPSATWEITELGSDRLSSCDEAAPRVVVTFNVPHDALFLVMGRNSPQYSYDRYRFSGAFEHGTQATELTFGTTTCSGPWRDAAPGTTGRFYVGTIDITGRLRLGRWFDVALPNLPRDAGPPDDADTPPFDSSGCATAGADVSTLVFLLIIGACRRRRRT